MNKLVVSMLSGACILASGSAFAAQHMKPGLWEMTMKSDEMAKHMPKMSAQQMAQLRKMGVNVPQMKDGAIITRVCISKEMAERDQPPAVRKDASCQSKNYQRNGNAFSVDIVCNGPDLKGTGTSKGVYADNGTFSSTYDFTGTAHGQPVKQHHESSGKWLGADCGKVQPASGY